MGMIKVINTGCDYSEALKGAIARRRDNTITRAEDDLLGRLVYNIARWAVADYSRERLSDEDLIGEIQLHLVTVLDRIDIDRPGKAIIMYLKRAGDNRLISIDRANGRQKRTGELVSIEDIPLATDFFGRPIKN